jgi:hypothetical protein
MEMDPPTRNKIQALPRTPSAGSSNANAIRLLARKPRCRGTPSMWVTVANIGPLGTKVNRK